MQESMFFSVAIVSIGRARRRPGLLTIFCSVLLCLIANSDLAFADAPARGHGAGAHRAADSAGISWDPKRTWVFAVGVLEWQDKSLTPFTKSDRRDKAFVDALIDDGVPKDHVVYIADRDATLSNIQAKFPQFLSRTQSGDTLFFYYCGHGWIDSASKVGCFANYDVGKGNQGWSTAAIAKDMKDFRGSNAIFAVDCCHSGSLADVLEHTRPSYNFAVLTSAVGGESSTSNWTFTQSIVDCLKGHRFADMNNDGLTSFTELGNYVRDEMKEFEKQDADVAASSGFDRSYRFAVDKYPAEPLPRRAEALWGGKWWPAKVIDRRNNECKVRRMTIGWDTAKSDSWIAASKVKFLDDGKGINRAHAVGDKVQVLWKGNYYKARIEQAKDGKYFVHYNGYDTSWDEWIPPERIR